jgi:hypothetical protein
MFSLNRARISVSAVLFLGFCAFSQPSQGIWHYTPISPVIPSTGNPSLLGQGSMNIQWPANTINLSQLENIFTQNPGISQFNIQFPNQSNWGITPNAIQSIYNTFEQEAQSVGVTGKLPDLSFSSLAETTMKSGLPQLMINPNGDIKSQMDDILRQLRYQSLDLGNYLPDWLKRIVLAVYDAVYSVFDFLGAQLAALVVAQHR